MLGLIATCLVAMQTPTEADEILFMRRLHAASHMTTPPVVLMEGLNHGDPGELRFLYAYAEKDEPPGEFDMMITVVDPAIGRAVATARRHVVARRVPQFRDAMYFDPQGPEPGEGMARHFMARFDRRLPPGRYRVTVSAGGGLAMTRDYAVR